MAGFSVIKDDSRKFSFYTEIQQCFYKKVKKEKKLKDQIRRVYESKRRRETSKPYLTEYAIVNAARCRKSDIHTYTSANYRAHN